MENNIVCNRCGFLCYSASAPEYLKSGCPHCGAGKLSLRRRTEHDQVTMLNDEFVYSFDRFLYLVAGLTIISMMIHDDPYIRAFSDTMEYIELKAAQKGLAEVSLEGLEILTPRLESILFALRRSDLELPESEDMVCVGMMREDIVGLLSHAAA